MESAAPEWVIIALGANLGEPAATLVTVLNRLAGFSTRPILRSSFWNTSPVDCPPGSPVFVNAAAALCPLPGETPVSLLDKLQSLEREFGRRPKVVLNEPRPLDLDIIAWGTLTLMSERLTLPHPRAHLRKFVLQPVAEILPDFVLPGRTESVKVLLRDLKTDESVRLLV
ncbi:MAG TPA: 2-amino-4-hydroxy-6-hydroxymethyldihydropteridine diphosphokinase [Candidatus Limnocylindria bacterium]|jgi:2-amino-4-hydroxy-6-hydroxymethyldihydropteridine diphosphokinase|nr:2-amino-4-hydroxy-6-hydroxymethyldihydropteridine diphosphokinase [Candidatus Limnocylindria bacterium]